MKNVGYLCKGYVGRGPRYTLVDAWSENGTEPCVTREQAVTQAEARGAEAMFYFNSIPDKEGSK
jgi:hypothetical protein